MLAKLMAVLQLTNTTFTPTVEAPVTDRIYDDVYILAPYSAPVVGPSINPNVSLAPIVNCNGITLAKSLNLSVDVLAHCASGRVGWVKL